MAMAPQDGGVAPVPAGVRIGHYEIIEEMARGGMGIVYRARDVRLDREVALKRPRPEHTEDPHARQRFLREARLAASLSHPNIVPIHEIFEEDGVPWIAMQLITGSSLREKLAGRKPLPTLDTLRHGEALTQALEAAHQRHILHRDVNPNNVVISEDGRALLTDFGLARYFVQPDQFSSASTASDEATAPGAVVGTRGYMSPEQVLGREVDARSDIFAMGAVLYEMGTGKAAFAPESANSMDRILHGQPEAMSRLNYDVPEDLERIVRKALSKRPDERYQSAREMTSDLVTLRRKLQSETYLADSGVAAPRPRPWVPAAAAAGLAVSLLIAGALVFREPQRQAPPQADVQARDVVAVLPFRDMTGAPDGDLMAQMLADLVAVDLSDSRWLRAADAQRVRELTRAAGVSRDVTRQRLARSLGPRWLVEGSLYRDGDGFVASVDVLPGPDAPPAGEGAPPERSFRVAGTRVGALAHLVASRLRQALAPGPAEPPVSATAPEREVSDQARLLEFRARQALFEGRYLEAIRDLERALDLEPDFLTARARLAVGMDRAGFGQKAREISAQALRQAESGAVPVTPRQELTIRAIHAQVRDSFGEEASARAALADLFPDEPELLFDLAGAVTHDARAEEALAIADRGLALDPSNPEGHLRRARILVRLRNYGEAGAALEKAASLYAAVPSPGGVAEAAFTRGYLEFHRQEFEAAARAYAEAASGFAGAGLDVKALEARKSEGDMWLKLGNLPAAEQHYGDLIPAARAAGNHRLVVGTLSSLGGQLYMLGEHGRAESVLRQAVEEARILSNPQIILSPLLNLAVLLNYTGKPGEGKAMATEALAAARERRDRQREAFALSQMAQADYQIGRLDEAIQAYRDLVSREQGESGSRENLGRAYASLAAVLESRENTGEGLQAVDAALQIEADLGKDAQRAYSLVTRGHLLAKLGAWQEAEPDLREAGEIADRFKLADVTARIKLIEGAIHTMRGEWARAAAALSGARQAGADMRTIGLEVPALILECEGKARAGKPAEAERLCRTAMSHPVALALEQTTARAALAEALLLRGSLDEAEDMARQALDEAERMDLPLPAARAAAVLCALASRRQTPPPPAIQARGQRALSRFVGWAPEARRGGLEERTDVQRIMNELGLEGSLVQLTPTGGRQGGGS